MLGPRGIMCVSIVCFGAEGGRHRAGLKVYQEVRRRARWRKGELKWRKLVRAVGVEEALVLAKLVRRMALYADTGQAHIVSVAEARLELVTQLLVSAVESLGIVSTTVLDQGLVPGGDTVLGKVKRSVNRLARRGRVSHVRFGAGLGGERGS